MGDKNSNGSWTEMGRLVLNELERVNKAQTELTKEVTKLTTQIQLVKQEVDQHRDVDEKTFEELAGDIRDIRKELVAHLKEVNDVWSPKQMQQAKNEVYRQKNYMAKVAGIVIATQVLVGLFLAFKDKIMP